MATMVALVETRDFVAAVANFKGISHHVEEEEGELFPQLRRRASDQIASLGDSEDVEEDVKQELGSDLQRPSQQRVRTDVASSSRWIGAERPAELCDAFPAQLLAATSRDLVVSKVDPRAVGGQLPSGGASYAPLAADARDSATQQSTSPRTVWGSESSGALSLSTAI